MAVVKNRTTLALLVFALCLCAYHANGTVLEEGDAIPNTTLPVALMAHGGLSYTPETFPNHFSWYFAFRDWNNVKVGPVHAWHETTEGKTYSEWRRLGRIKLRKPAYYLVWSEKQQVYANTYGPVAGLTFVPLMSLLMAVDSAVHEKQELLLSAAKLHASALVAFSAVLIFLIALPYGTKPQALLLALCYALGTCVWSISSQNLWQQTANIFFATLGVFFLSRLGSRPLLGALCGLAFGAVVACRPTGVLLLLAVFAYLCLYHRKAAIFFGLTAWIFPALVGWYNYHFFDDPFVFGQTIIGKELAMEKTGSEDSWQTPMWKGALAQLIGPSRGLLVYSPVLAFAVWGAVRAWINPAYRVLRPLTVATVAIACVQFKWFDWWGGWAYGYRPLVDLVPFLVLFMLPIIGSIIKRRVLLGVFSVTLAWSVFVQGVGAFSYDKAGWNERVLHAVVLKNWERRMLLTAEEARQVVAKHGGKYLGTHACNIDYPYCRYRLWLVKDSQILYFISHFSESRANRLESGWYQLNIPTL